MVSLIAWVKYICKTLLLTEGPSLARAWNPMGRLMDRSWSVPTLSPSLKPLKSYFFMDFNFNVLAPQTINYRLRVSNTFNLIICQNFYF